MEENSVIMVAASSENRGKPLILHVEDDPRRSEMLEDILQGDGFAVLQANTAQEALHICQETPVSLVLADHMRGFTGTELAWQIKAMKLTVPLVMHPGNLPTSMRNLDGFINKGEPVQALLAFVKQHGASCCFGGLATLSGPG